MVRRGRDAGEGGVEGFDCGGRASWGFVVSGGLCPWCIGEGGLHVDS